MVEKWRKKPVTVDAIQYIGTKESYDELVKFINSSAPALKVSAKRGGLTTFTESTVYITMPNDQILQMNTGDFLVKGIDGSIYPVRKNTFYRTYEKVENGEITW